ncbi:MAG: N-acetylmuramoyl-L-alanine amidase, partial [Chloroflexaceae bacterium]|nr:N-acetylmuramoyl-L-alanine amidase [Chloroflexaceae bacterium]
PLGQAQQPSAVQWQQCTALMEALIAHYGWKGRNVVRAHREESQTACPGNVVMGLLNQYRTPVAPPDTSVKGTYRTTLRVMLRQAPQRQAKNIVRVLPGGQKVEVGALVQGEAVQGDSRWAWLSSGEGFIHFPHLEKVA